MDNFGRDRFELLSAYLDGEVTATERQQVQQWLKEDLKVRQLYYRLLSLRQGMQQLPTPTPQQSPQQLSAAVFKRLDQRQQRKQGVLWGGAIAAVALVVGSISGLSRGNSPFPQFADNSPEPNADQLVIALNRPAVTIPSAAVAPNSNSLIKLNKPAKN